MGAIRMPETSRYYIREILERNSVIEDRIEIPVNTIVRLLRDYAVLEYLLDERSNQNDIYKEQIKEYTPPFIYPHDGTWYDQSKTGNASWEVNKPSV